MPLSFLDESGQAQGIYPDLLREIAKKEGWELEFIKDNWSGCLARLESGEIDLMISIVRTPERQKIYDFSTLPVVTAWGQVYTEPQKIISSILDLEKKTIGIMAKDINGRHLKNLVQKFKVNARFMDFPVYDDLCLALAEKKIHAAVINNINGAHFQQKYKLHPTPILFSPIDAYFAVRKGTNSHILSGIDRCLSLWKKDKDSVYYAILARWYGNLGSHRDTVLKWILGITGLIAVSGTGF
ncbi:MAG: transporter substrate-binding domain-containing protein [Desulfobacter sp.]|nr:transporter substrate-binding domain-containing protein [Desulfobacter sp.]WDP85228.1 MAG: transporter substrate-binding domain-containing protein [Desulfobacter sp.]